MAQKIIIKRGGKFIEQTRKKGGGFTEQTISKQEGQAAIEGAKIRGGTARRGAGKGKVFFKGTNIPKPIVTEIVSTTGKRKLTSAGKAVEQIRREQFFKGTKIPKPLVTEVTRGGKTFVTPIGQELQKQRKRFEKIKEQETAKLKKQFPNWKKEALAKGWGAISFETFLLYKQAELDTQRSLRGLAGRQIVINSELKAVREKAVSFPKVKIGNKFHTPRTKAESDWFKKIAKVVERDEKFKKAFSGTLKDVGLNINDSDRWYTRALKGAGQTGIGILFTGGFITNAIDKAILTGKGIFAGGEISKGVRQEAFGRAIRETPKAAVAGFDPTKPENWTNIILTVAGIKATRGALIRTNTRFGKSFVPSVKNAGAMETALQSSLKKISAAKRLAKDGIKAKSNVAANKRLLTKLSRLEPSVKASIRTVRKIIKDPKTLKLEDMNPLTQTTKLLKNIGKERTVFHATATSFKDLFGQKFTQLKSVQSILKAVKRASGKPRAFKEVGELNNFLLKYFKRNRAIIGGGKAQNIFVKGFLKRKTFDFDVLVRNNKLFAASIAKALKKKFPSAKVEVVKKRVAFTIKFNGKEIMDVVKFSKIPVKGVKVLTSPDGLKVLAPETLAKLKLTTVGKGLKRSPKDAKDLRRLVGDVFSDSKFKTKVKDPRNLVSVREQPKGMGASRIKFGENQMFFDLEVPTGYAYQTLAKNLISPKIISIIKKVPVPKSLQIFKNSFVQKLNSLKFVRASDRFTVLSVKTRVSTFPPKLASRIKNAARGKLTVKQQNKLRADINSFINKNPNKVFVGSRTGSRALGEREVVAPVGTKLVGRRGGVVDKVKRKVGIDPETKLFFDVIEVGLKKAPKKVPFLSKLKARIKELKKDPFIDIRRRFRKGDISKWRSVQRAIRKTDKLTNAQYKDLLTVIRIMFKSKAAKGRVVKGGLRTVKKRRKPKAITQRPRGAVRRAAGAQKVKEPPKKRRKPISRPKRQPIRKPVKRVKKRVSARVVKRVPSRSLSRVRTPIRSRPRPRGRPSKRTRATPKPRPRPRPKPRPRPRPITRPRPRPRPRPRLTPRQFQTLRKRIPIRLRKKRLSVKDKKDLIEIFKKAPVTFRPSLAAVIFNITAYKIPKSITGFEIRPIIINR